MTVDQLVLSITNLNLQKKTPQNKKPPSKTLNSFPLLSFRQVLLKNQCRRIRTQNNLIKTAQESLKATKWNICLWQSQSPLNPVDMLFIYSRQSWRLKRPTNKQHLKAAAVKTGNSSHVMFMDSRLQAVIAANLHPGIKNIVHIVCPNTFELLVMELF